MTAAPGPQQSDEVRRFRPHDVPPSAAELREQVVAEWLWEHDHGQFGGHFGEDGEHHTRYIDLARDLLDREELFPAALSAQPDPCPDCGHRHNPLAFCKAKQCTACGQGTYGGGLCSDCSSFPAAPSAQPDCGHPNHGGDGHDCAPFRTPAQPVRDTEEGRR